MGLKHLPTLAEMQSAPRPAPKNAEAKQASCQRCGRELLSRRRRFCGRGCAGAFRGEKRRKPRPPCRSCGAPVGRWHAKTCSLSCRRKLKEVPSRRCRRCGHKYRQTQRTKQIRFCSMRCYDAQRIEKAWIKTSCTGCDKAMRCRQKKTGQRFCSTACRSKFFVGDRNAVWRGGADDWRGSGWKQLAESIRKRDGRQCKHCGRTQLEEGRQLPVDHIRPWRSFTDKNEANHPDNLVTLCGKCHAHKTHSIERRWLKGDVLALVQFERAVKSKSLFTEVSAKEG